MAEQSSSDGTGADTADAAERIRCASDRELFRTLMKDRTVVKVNEQIARAEETGPIGTRRHLLSTSVRLSHRMAGDLHGMAEHCFEKLGLDIPLELYVYASPQFNAACFKPEAGQLFVMFSSGLLEAFDQDELRFVMGHELGHHVYSHHDLPIGYILRGKARPSPKLALELFAWSRYAEISADRAGAYCADNFDAVGRALFKLASGLSGATIEFHLDDFLQQVDAMQVQDAEPGQGAPQQDWFSTHPFSPLRVKALQYFERSVALGGDVPMDDLEVHVQRLMALMEPSYLEGRTEVAEIMRRLLFAGALVVANADGKITDEEIAVFEKFFGKNSFSDKLNLDSLEADLDARINQVLENASSPQAMQVLRDLCTVARAEETVGERERAVLDRIADRLHISRGFICQSLESEVELD